MTEHAPTSSAPEHKAAVYSMGTYIAKNIHRIDYWQDFDDDKAFDDDRIARINNVYADRDIPLRPDGEATTVIPTLLTDSLLDSEHEGENHDVIELL